MDTSNKNIIFFQFLGSGDILSGESMSQSVMDGVRVVRSFDVILGSIESIVDFVNIVNRYPFEVDLISGKYVIDAKSIMGIFSLDVTQPVKVEIEDGYERDICNFMEEVKKYICNK